MTAVTIAFQISFATLAQSVVLTPSMMPSMIPSISSTNAPAIANTAFNAAITIPNQSTLVTALTTFLPIAFQSVFSKNSAIALHNPFTASPIAAVPLAKSSLSTHPLTASAKLLPNFFQSKLVTIS